MLVDHCVNKKELLISHIKIIKFVENYCEYMWINFFIAIH